MDLDLPEKRFVQMRGNLIEQQQQNKWKMRKLTKLTTTAATTTTASTKTIAMELTYEFEKFIILFCTMSHWTIVSLGLIVLKNAIGSTVFSLRCAHFFVQRREISRKQCNGIIQICLLDKFDCKRFFSWNLFSMRIEEIGRINCRSFMRVPKCTKLWISGRMV